MSNMKKIDLNRIYVFDEKHSVYETVQINPMPFADRLKNETEKHNLHGAKGVVEEVFNKEVAQYVEKAYPAADEAAKYSSSTLGQYAGNAVGKFSKVEDAYKLWQHIGANHPREVAVEGAGILCGGYGAVAGGAAGGAVVAAAGLSATGAGAAVGAMIIGGFAAGGAYVASEGCKEIATNATDPRELSFRAANMAPTIVQDGGKWFGDAQFVMMNYNWYLKTNTDEIASVNGKIERVYQYNLITDAEKVQELSKAVLQQTGYFDLVKHIQQESKQGQDQKREINNQQQFRQSEIADLNNAAYDANNAKRTMTEQDIRQRNVAKGLSPNGYSLEEVNIIKKPNQEDIRLFAEKDKHTGQITETTLQKTAAGFHTEEKFYDATGRHLQKSIIEDTNKLHVLTVYDKLGNQNSVAFEAVTKDTWRLSQFTQQNAQTDGAIKESWQAQNVEKVNDINMQDIPSGKLRDVASILTELPVSPRGIPLGVTGVSQTMEDGTTLTASAKRLDDGKIVEHTWYKVDQDMSNKRDIYQANGTLSKTVSHYYDAEKKENTATVLLLNEQGKLDYRAHYKQTNNQTWELTEVVNNKGHALEKSEKATFERNHPHDKMLELSSVKKAGLDFDQLPENVRKVATLLEKDHLGQKLAEKGLSPEEIQNTCVALASKIGQCPGRHPKEILTAFVDKNGDLQAFTSERYSPSVPLETAKTQSFEQSIAKMDQAVEQRQQQAMERSQNQSQGGPVHSMGGHRMV